MSLLLVCTVFLVHVCSATAAQEEPLSIPADEKITACGLDGFQIDTLAQASYWSVPFAREHLDKCVVPDGYERHQVSSCQLHFSVCRRIPEGICEGHFNSTTCLEVVTEDGHRHYYSMEESRENNAFKSYGYTSSSDGFFSVRHGNIHHHRSCHGQFKISLKFVCDRDGVWNPHSHDAAPHVRVIIVSDPCHLEMVFGYSGACQKVASTLAPATTNSCPIFPPYNLTGLTRYDYWFAKVPNRFCYFIGLDVVKDCEVYFTFCRALPVEQIEGIGSVCSGAAVCQTIIVEEGLRYHEVTYNLGQFKNFTRFFYNGKTEGGGFHMDVGNGTRIHECRNDGIKTQIILVCNSSAVWTSRDLTRIIQFQNTGPCEYNFILPYNGACLPVFPNATVQPSTSTVHPTTTTPSKINSTSVHPHPTSSLKPPHTSSHRHTINSTTKHSTTPIRNSTVRTSTVHTTPHHTINSTAKHPTTSVRNSTIRTTHIIVTTPTSSRWIATTTVVYSTTTAPHVVTTNPAPVDPERRIILGLTGGLVLFGVISIVLLVMVIITVRFVIKKRRLLKFIKTDS